MSITLFSYFFLKTCLKVRICLPPFQAFSLVKWEMGCSCFKLLIHLTIFFHILPLFYAQKSPLNLSTLALFCIYGLWRCFCSPFLKLGSPESLSFFLKITVYFSSFSLSAILFFVNNTFFYLFLSSLLCPVRVLISIILFLLPLVFQKSFFLLGFPVAFNPFPFLPSGSQIPWKITGHCQFFCFVFIFCILSLFCILFLSLNLAGLKPGIQNFYSHSLKLSDSFLPNITS